MKLIRAELEGIRDLPRIRLDVAAGRIVCVTGGPGTGKTSVLEAILAARDACLPAPVRHDASAWVRSASARAFVELEWALEPLERKIAPAESATFTAIWRPGDRSDDVPARMRDRVAASPILYLDAHRLSAPPSPFAAERAPTRPRELTEWAPSAEKFGWVEGWLLARTERRAEELAARVDASGVALGRRDESLFARALERLCVSVRPGPPVHREGKRLAGFLRRDQRHLALAELATHERMAVLVAAAMDTSSGALVLVDTPELGLHPSEHATFLASLASLASSGVIAATTSAAILRAAPGGTVVSIG